jgi:pentatricopeptide repeat protein
MGGDEVAQSNHILKRGLLHCEPYLGTLLVEFFGQSGRFDGALKVFGEMTVKRMVTWNCQPTGEQQLPAAGRPALIERTDGAKSPLCAPCSVPLILSLFRISSSSAATQNMATSSISDNQLP